MATPIGHGIFFMSSAPPNHPQLSAREAQYVQELVAMPLDSILDNGIGEEKCKELGQKIFDQAKTSHNGNSSAAQDVVVKICNAVRFNQSDDERNASLRKQYIERAWDGIGDDTWHWRA